jgi:D-alanine--poly(phosphoribitol) ligase subunit 1
MKSNNDLSFLIDKYLDQKKNKKIFFDKINQFNIFKVRTIINNIKKNLFKLSKKRNKNLIIGILLERNVYYLISIFACWQSGATIIPLNKNWPKKHLDEIKKKLKFDYILTDEKNFKKDKINLHLKNILKKNNDEISNNALIDLRKKNTSPYIIFTSGSSGFQKGVEISSDGYLDYIKWTKNNFKKYKNFSPLIITAEMTFDITMGDIAFALANKTSIVISSSAKNFFEHLHLINKYKVEIFYSVPSTINLILDYSKINNEIKSIKLFMSGGDVFNIGMIEKIIQNNPKSVFYNVYGPTECTINVTSLRMDDLYKKNKIKKISIGKVFKNLNYKLINNKNGKFIENKIRGELIISGNQVMKDYVNKEDANKNYFLYLKNKKYYRTGDLVEIKDKLLYLKGRVDDLVKIRGYRVNPLEVDNVILNSKKISISKTIVDKRKNRLITFIQLNKKNKISEINEFIQKNLPNYMIPTKLVALKKFPLGKSGKVDKKKLINLYGY